VDLIELEQADGRRHPWETARLRFFQGLLRRSVGPGRTVLDVGAGDAWLARALLRGGEAARVTCWDLGYTPALLARHGLAGGEALAYVAARPGGRFDLLLLLDVLEHVEDDAGLLSGLVEASLAPGGHALLSVPAWPTLFSAHDARLQHLRRYRPAALRALAAGAGLEVVAAGGLFHALLPLRALGVLRERLGHRGPPSAPVGISGWRAPAPVTLAVEAALALDTAVTRLLLPLRLSLPGLSTWVLCRKPPPS
jgi:SAM-dependent methyltransferase